MNASMSLLQAEPRAQRQMMELRTELQSAGLRLVDPNAGAASRRGGAGPSDHKAVTVDGVTIMVPVHTSSAWNSPFVAGVPDESGASALLRGTIPIASISFPKAPRFTQPQTLDGVPYSHIATLHSTDVLATTVLQTCIRYESRKKTCKFCAIGQSLAAGRTIARKTPEQLAEVARAAVLLDGVKHMVLTTGTPPTPDRGAQILCESAFAIKVCPCASSRPRPVRMPRTCASSSNTASNSFAPVAPRGGVDGICSTPCIRAISSIKSTSRFKSTRNVGMRNVAGSGVTRHRVSGLRTAARASP